MKNKLNFEDFRKIIFNIDKTVQEEKLYLSKLDSVIGDGDHGATIAKGFASAIKNIEEKKPTTISEILKITGKSIMSTIGGVAGPVFGYFFSGMGNSIDDKKKDIYINDLYDMFSAALDKIMEIGGAKPGDKTMVDALFPAVSSLEKYLDSNEDIKAGIGEMVKASKEGAESTKKMISKKGRSRYSGERSIGYEDAGANTVYFIFKAFHEAL